MMPFYLLRRGKLWWCAQKKQRGARTTVGTPTSVAAAATAESGLQRTEVTAVVAMVCAVTKRFLPAWCRVALCAKQTRSQRIVLEACLTYFSKRNPDPALRHTSRRLARAQNSKHSACLALVIRQKETEARLANLQSKQHCDPTPPSRPPNPETVPGGLLRAHVWARCLPVVSV